jgi:hypothetical protein
MKPENDLDRRIAASRIRAATLKFQSAVQDFNTAVLTAMQNIESLRTVLAPFEEWPEVVLEDVLDAEYLGEET